MDGINLAEVFAVLAPPMVGALMALVAARVLRVRITRGEPPRRAVVMGGVAVGAGAVMALALWLIAPLLIAAVSLAALLISARSSTMARAAGEDVRVPVALTASAALMSLAPLALMWLTGIPSAGASTVGLVAFGLGIAAVVTSVGPAAHDADG